MTRFSHLFPCRWHHGISSINVFFVRHNYITKQPIHYYDIIRLLNTTLLAVFIKITKNTTGVVIYSCKSVITWSCRWGGPWALVTPVKALGLEWDIKKASYHGPLLAFITSNPPFLDPLSIAIPRYCFLWISLAQREMTHDHHRLHQMLKRQIVECITYLLCQYPMPPIPTTYVYIVYLLYPIPIISIFKSHTYHVYINHIPYLPCLYQTYTIPTIGTSISHTYLETISTIFHT